MINICLYYESLSVIYDIFAFLPGRNNSLADNKVLKRKDTAQRDILTTERDRHNDGDRHNTDEDRHNTDRDRHNDGDRQNTDKDRHNAGDRHNGAHRQNTDEYRHNTGNRHNDVYSQNTEGQTKH